MKRAACLLSAFFLYACASISSSPDELRRTWDGAHVRVLHGEIYAFGVMSVSSNQQALARLPQGVKFPTVVYLHGCQGMDLENASETMGALLRQGFAIIAPDSYALSNRTEACNTGNRSVWWVRAAEARYAAERVLELPWVDAENLFLVGHSEGGAGAAAYRGRQFNAIVISAYGCPDGIASSIPTLVVAADNDPQIRNVSGICVHAGDRMIFSGTQHHVLRNKDVAGRVLTFLRTYLK
jgi:poly(3-hydroxybutyrate) depolymerase